MRKYKSYIEFKAPRKVKPSPFKRVLKQSVKPRVKYHPDGFCFDSFIERTNRDKYFVTHY